jgi:MYXO-CTERM domain-containing protein
MQFDVSNFEVFYTCPNTPILNPVSNVSFTGELTKTPGFKFDSIGDEQPSQIWFSFSSPNAPEMGELRWKAGQINTYEHGLVPSCHIPEVGSAGLGAVGAFFVLRRRRFH